MSQLRRKDEFVQQVAPGGPVVGTVPANVILVLNAVLHQRLAQRLGALAHAPLRLSRAKADEQVIDLRIHFGRVEEGRERLFAVRVAGTEKGVTEPKATFSTCFGAPFLPLNPNVYAKMLGEKIARHNAQVWLVNTGWTGGPYGLGSRMKIAHTRAMITAALTGQLDTVKYQRHGLFNLDVPVMCPGVPTVVLDPRSTWADQAHYDEHARTLAQMFVEHFKAFERDVACSVKQAGPAV